LSAERGQRMDRRKRVEALCRETPTTAPVHHSTIHRNLIQNALQWPPQPLPQPPPPTTPHTQGQEKMSKSDPNSAIFMEDSEAEVNTKIKKAFCPPLVRYSV